MEMTRKELSEIYYLDKELKRCERMLSNLIESSQIKAQTIDGMPIQHCNGTSDKVSETAIKVIAHADMVIEYKNKIKDKKMEIDKWIMSLDDFYLKQIVYYRCIELMDWEKVADMLGGGNTAAGCRMYFNRHIKKE